MERIPRLFSLVRGEHMTLFKPMRLEGTLTEDFWQKSFLALLRELPDMGREVPTALFTTMWESPPEKEADPEESRATRCRRTEFWF